MDPVAQRESESRTWAMLAHLSVLLNLLAPFGGLIATILIYALRTSDLPQARENQRHALNFEITVVIAYVILFALYFASFITLFVTAGGARPHATSGSMPPFFFLVFGVFGIVLLLLLYSVVVACSSARAAWLGRVAQYPVSFRFVKAPVT